jgi:hypothetical protein
MVPLRSQRLRWSRGSEPSNNAPSFASDPINEIDATEDAAYSSTLADDASDPEGDPMTFTFSEVSGPGPSWLSVSTNGVLSGTPGATNIGDHVFTVQVDATGGSDTATLNITVNAEAQAAFLVADAHVRGGTRGNDNFGGVEDLRLKDDGAGDRNTKVAVFRFDTTADDYSTAEAINLSLFVSQAEDVSGTVYLYGVTGATANGLALQNFVEGTGLGTAVAGITYNNGGVFNTSALGIDDSLASGYLFDSEASDTDGVATALASRDFETATFAGSEGDNWNFSTAAMLDFAQASTDDTLTFLMIRLSDTPLKSASFASKENMNSPIGNGLAGPTLSVMEP